MPPRTLVAGIGNIFLGDDGFGVEVVKRLAAEPLPEGVDVKDFGIRGVHLAYELADDRYDAVILVDAVPRGKPPGTLYVVEPTTSPEDGEAPSVDAHALTPAVVLAWLRKIGRTTARITIVGCEPESVHESMGLSAPVASAVDGAVTLVRELIGRLQG